MPGEIRPLVDAVNGAMDRLAGQLLDLARKQHARQVDAGASSPVTNLSRVAREAAAVVVPLAEEAGRALDVDLPPSLLVTG
jgi:hypothetical protein